MNLWDIIFALLYVGALIATLAFIILAIWGTLHKSAPPHEDEPTTPQA